jgi:hypothetical protein
LEAGECRSSGLYNGAFAYARLTERVRSKTAASCAARPE